MKTIPVLSELNCLTPEEYFLQSCPGRGLALTPMRINVERCRAILNGLASCGEDSSGFTIRQEDVMHCLDTVNGLLEQVEFMINKAEEAMI